MYAEAQAEASPSASKNLFYCHISHGSNPLIDPGPQSDQPYSETPHPSIPSAPTPPSSSNHTTTHGNTGIHISTNPPSNLYTSHFRFPPGTLITTATTTAIITTITVAGWRGIPLNLSNFLLQNPIHLYLSLSYLYLQLRL